MQDMLLLTLFRIWDRG